MVGAPASGVAHQMVGWHVDRIASVSLVRQGPARTPTRNLPVLAWRAWCLLTDGASMPPARPMVRGYWSRGLPARWPWRSDYLITTGRWARSGPAGRWPRSPGSAPASPPVHARGRAVARARPAPGAATPRRSARSQPWPRSPEQAVGLCRRHTRADQPLPGGRQQFEHKLGAARRVHSRSRHSGQPDKARSGLRSLGGATSISVGAA